MFVLNNVSMGDLAGLFKMWADKGIKTATGLVCCSCTKEDPLPKKPRGAIKKISADIQIIKSHPEDRPTHYLREESRLESVSKTVGPPLHLYLLLDGGKIVDQDELKEFVGAVNCPFTLEFEGASYTLMSQGYYSNKHYFSKVYRHAGGLSGIWLQNNAENDGYARLISRVPSEIAGTSPDSSWLINSRQWTQSEGAMVDASIKKISEDHPEASGTSSFSHLKSVLSPPKNLASQDHVQPARLLVEEQSETAESESEETKSETTEESEERKIHKSDMSDQQSDALNDEIERKNHLNNNNNGKLEDAMKEDTQKGRSSEEHVNIAKGKRPLWCSKDDTNFQFLFYLFLSYSFSISFLFLIFSLIYTKISSNIIEESESTAKFTLENNSQIYHHLTGSGSINKSTYSVT
jgi:hypothetical protein